MADERYHVLARKWRPSTFTEIVGQEHVSRSLANAIRHGRVHHAYLFCGPRGVGKTTIARVLSKALNCENSDGPTADPCLECSSCRGISDGTSMDVLEIDGASNNSVEQIRDLRETLGYSPAESRYRIIIIDEVHMLSRAAFNALLKSLEEPPPHVAFIFATTEANKVLPTVQSRCQRYDFHRLTVTQIRGQLQHICEAENVDMEPAGIDLIAQRADGAMRDGQSLLDQVTAALDGHIAADQVADLIGAVEREVYLGLLDAVADSQPAETLGVVARTVNRGRSLGEFLGGLMMHLRHLLACAIGASEALSEVDESDQARLVAQAARFSERDLVRMLSLVADTESQLNASAAPQVRVELALLKLVYMERSVELADLMAQLEGIAGADQTNRRPPTPRARGAANQTQDTPSRSTKPESEDDEPEPASGNESASAAFAKHLQSTPVEEPKDTPESDMGAENTLPVEPPEEEEPAPTKAEAPAANIKTTLAVLTARWPEINDELQNEHGLPSWIDTQIRPVALENGKLQLTAQDAFHTSRFRSVEAVVMTVVGNRFPDVTSIEVTEAQEHSSDKDVRSRGRAGDSVVEGAVKDEPVIGKLVDELGLVWEE
jgi:DNA polymerase III subunit gamma/tau